MILDDQVVIDFLSKPIALKEEQKQQSVQNVLSEASAITQVLDQSGTFLPMTSNKKVIDEFMPSHKKPVLNTQTEQEKEPLLAGGDEAAIIGLNVDRIAPIGRKTMHPASNHRFKEEDEATLIRQLELGE